MNPGLLPVRATVHLQGLFPGARANVDLQDPYIAGLIEAQFLVPIHDHHVPPVRESEDRASSQLSDVDE